MSAIGQPELVTQKRVIALFRDELGYRYLGRIMQRRLADVAQIIDLA